MNQMAAMMAQMNKMKRDLKNAKEELAKKEFVISKAGAVKVTVLGNKTVKSVEIDKDAFNPDDQDMVQDMIAAAINEGLEQVEKAEGDINEAITGSRAGFNQ